MFARCEICFREITHGFAASFNTQNTRRMKKHDQSSASFTASLVRWSTGIEMGNQELRMTLHIVSYEHFKCNLPFIY